MKAKILKKLTVDGKTLETGDIVDVSGWRNAKSLEGSRYITFVADTEIPKKESKSKPEKDLETE